MSIITKHIDGHEYMLFWGGVYKRASKEAGSRLAGDATTKT